MLKAVQEKESSVLKFTISGVLDESVDFKHLFGQVNSTLHIVCRDVERINSYGVKSWSEYFGQLRARGCKLRFIEVSPILVVTINHVSHFINDDELESFCAPFHCVKCKKDTLKIFTPREAIEFSKNVQPIPCGECKTSSPLDEDPKEFFEFLSNIKPGPGQ